MNRKTFFKGVALGTLSLPLFLRSCINDNTAQSEKVSGFKKNKVYKWKMVTTWPPNSPALDESCKLFSKLVEEMSEGRLLIHVYGGGELVPALGTFDAVRSGSVEMGSGASYYWAGKIPAAQFFASVPFGLNAWQMNTWILKGGGLDLWTELYADYNLVPFMLGNTGVQAGGWFNKAIHSMSDLKGLKMRIPGLGGKVLAKAGGTPVLLAGGELYTGLERGVIDATEWLGPYHDYKMGFYQIAKYYYYPGWHEPGTNLELIINKEAYNELPADLKAIVKTAASYTHQWFTTELEYKNMEYLPKLKEMEGLNIDLFPKEVLQSLKAFTKEVVLEVANSDPFARRVYDSIQSFNKLSKEYSNLTEKAYYNTMM